MLYENNPNFYPTPTRLIRKMIEKIETLKCKYILEPSAGAGHIIDYYKEYYKNHNSRYIGYQDTVDKYITFDAIEIDNNLTATLRGKGINVIWDDFLSFEPQRFYQLIIANFPFDRGADHLLKAISIQERIGGEIICLLNSETIKHPYSNNRKELVKLLEKYNAEIEYIQNAFTDAERKTDVEIALIYINVPMQDDTTMFEREFKRENPDINFKDLNSIAVKRSKLEQLIFECEMIKKSGIELFKEKLKIEKMLEGMGLKSILKITDGGYKNETITVNDYINKINLEYWNKFINETEFKDRLPSKLRNNFNYNMERQKDITFNMENVQYFYEQLIKSIPQSYEETVATLFDDLTRKYVYSDSAWNHTIHYYNGWRSNSAFRISKRVIIPCGSGFYFYNLPEALVDLNIVFENISGIKDSLTKDDRVYKAIRNNEKNIETEFFIIDSYKKGTIHIYFKDQELLNQFNILAAKGKQWLPGDFGTKHYSDMNKEEKILVKEFGLTPEQYMKYTKQPDYLRLTS